MEKIHGVDAKIIHFEWYTKKIFALKVFSPGICKTAKAGQFVMIRGKNWNVGPVLNRPMSIARVARENNIIELHILVSGQGTELLSRLQVNDSIFMIGPLGNTLTLPDNNEKIALIAGGIGIAPLIFFDDELKNKSIQRYFFYGARNKDDLIPTALLPKNIRISTEDGSMGFKGFVTDDVKSYLSSKRIDRVFACGPTPMLEAVQKMVKKYNVPGEISIETEMACGFGICQGCVVRQQNTENSYLLTCKDGPVFDANLISLRK